jgi:hypothetical protein
VLNQQVEEFVGQGGEIVWARALFAAKYATGGVYINFTPGDENLFRMNQNVPPAK